MKKVSRFQTLFCSAALALLAGACRSTPPVRGNPNGTNAPGTITIPKPPIAYEGAAVKPLPQLPPGQFWFSDNFGRMSIMGR